LVYCCIYEVEELSLAERVKTIHKLRVRTLVAPQNNRGLLILSYSQGLLQQYSLTKNMFFSCGILIGLSINYENN
jgi:hypothetical protein